MEKREMLQYLMERIQPGEEGERRAAVEAAARLLLAGEKENKLSANLTKINEKFCDFS